MVWTETHEGEFWGDRLSLRVKITGVLVSYMVICERKAWFFARGLGMEQESDLVDIGRLIAESAYSRKKHEIDIDHTIVMDWVDWHNKIIHEVKKSVRMEEAHLWQVRYYIYYLERKGAVGFRGMINYPRQRRIKEVILNDDDRQKLQELLQRIPELLGREKPPLPVRIVPCSRCAYYEFCWV